MRKKDAFPAQGLPRAPEKAQDLPPSPGASWATFTEGTRRSGRSRPERPFFPQCGNDE
jgi:hypothetical protein